MRRQVILRLFCISILLALVSCENPMLETLKAVVRDLSQPTAEINFLTGTGIAEDTAVTVTFSETMDKQSLILSGTLAAESSNGWSTTTESDDTLTISPASAWSAGSGKTLTVECADLEGYEIKPIDVTYGVLDGTVYVHGKNGDDENPGTSDLPKQTMDAAVETVERVYSEASVFVAAGTYEISEPVIVTKNISLYGGFSSEDWALREEDQSWAVSGDDESAFPTILKASGTHKVISAEGEKADVLVQDFSVFGDISGDTTSAVYGYNAKLTVRSCNIKGGGGDSSTGISFEACEVLIEKNNILGGSASDTAYGISSIDSTMQVTDNQIDGGFNKLQTFGIACSDSINGSIENNDIRGGIINTTDSQSSTIAAAVWLSGSKPVIKNNTIYGGDTIGFSEGIVLLNGSDADIYNNSIDAGTASNGAMGKAINMDASSPVIRNNTICGGDVSLIDYIVGGEEGIVCTNSSHPVIENNIIFSKGSDGNIFRYGINASGNSAPASLKNNAINLVQSGIADAGPFAWNDNGTMEVVPDPNTLPFASDNNTHRADFTDETNSDFHLEASTHEQIRTGGLDGAALGWGFSTDLDGAARTGGGTTGWSMGCYEKD